ncbi:MAG: hypothetical protein C0523_07280 [Cytophaga sp.]|nr:hypothetical protein [Cytophaga sp.]
MSGCILLRKFILSYNSIPISKKELATSTNKKGILQTESVSSFKVKVATFNQIWRTNFTEHLAEGTGTETLK